MIIRRLATNQISRARSDGGKTIANRKRHLSQTWNAVRTLAEQPAELASLLTPADLLVLQRACIVFSHIDHYLKECVAEAKWVKADYDQRKKAATHVLAELPHSKPADVIALESICSYGRINSYTEKLLRDRDRFEADLQDIGIGCINMFSHDIASAVPPVDPVIRREHIRAQMPEHAAKHVDLIAAVNALEVARKLEQAA